MSLSYCCSAMSLNISSSWITFLPKQLRQESSVELSLFCECLGTLSLLRWCTDQSQFPAALLCCASLSSSSRLGISMVTQWVSELGSTACFLWYKVQLNFINFFSMPFQFTVTLLHFTSANSASSSLLPSVCAALVLVPVGVLHRGGGATDVEDRYTHPSPPTASFYHKTLQNTPEYRSYWAT